MANKASRLFCSCVDSGAVLSAGQKIKAAATSRAAAAPAASGHQVRRTVASATSGSMLSADEGCTTCSGASENDCITVAKLRSCSAGISGKSVKSGRSSPARSGSGGSISTRAPAFSRAVRYLRAAASSRLFLIVTALPLNRPSRRSGSSIRNSLPRFSRTVSLS